MTTPKQLLVTIPIMCLFVAILFFLAFNNNRDRKDLPYPTTAYKEEPSTTISQPERLTNYGSIRQTPTRIPLEIPDEPKEGQPQDTGMRALRGLIKGDLFFARTSSASTILKEPYIQNLITGSGIDGNRLGLLESVIGKIIDKNRKIYRSMSQEYTGITFDTIEEALKVGNWYRKRPDLKSVQLLTNIPNANEMWLSAKDYPHLYDKKVILDSYYLVVLMELEGAITTFGKEGEEKE